MPDVPWPPPPEAFTAYAVGELGTVSDPETMTRCADAAVGFCERERPDHDFTTGTAPAEYGLAALRFAANLYARRGVTGGSLAYGLEGAPSSYAADAEVARLLGLWNYRRPGVG
jgi:hypothetical protein